MAAALVFAPTAGAAVTASSVTTPADGAGFDVDDDTPGQITVTGTATADDPATDTVRLACTYSEQPSGSAASLAPAGATGGLTPTGAHTGSFSIQVPPNQFDYYTCRLRAVPSGALPADYGPFDGPVAHFSGHSTDPFNQPPELYDFYQDISGPLGYWDGYSTSDCFVYTTYTLDPKTLDYGQLFGCATVADAAPTGTRASLRVDGRDGFLPAEVRYKYRAITGAQLITGYARHLDPVTGDVRLTASEPVVRCANGTTTYPPPCPQWEGAGLVDRSATIGDHGGRLVRHTDVWTNSGSVARQLDVWYSVTTSNSAAQWRFPGQSTYAPRSAGDHSGAGGTIPTPPAGPASVLVADAPAQSGYSHPRGSVTWSSAPSEVRFTAPDRLYLHYLRTVPALGSAAVSLTFATDATQARADALRADARAGMLPRAVITAPADGSSVNTAEVTVRGTATDDGPASVNVNGHAASVAADGKWSVAVPLHEGANILVATATDTDGNTARAQRTVTRPTGNPPPPPPNQSPPSTQPIPSTPLMPSNQFTVKVNKASRKSIKLTFTVPGTGAIRAKLTASIPGAARTVTLATTRKTAKAAGRVKVTLRLSKKARALLRKHHKLRARLRATFTPTGGTARTKLKRVTLRAARSAR